MWLGIRNVLAHLTSSTAASTCCSQPLHIHFKQSQNLSKKYCESLKISSIIAWKASTGTVVATSTGAGNITVASASTNAGAGTIAVAFDCASAGASAVAYHVANASDDVG